MIKCNHCNHSYRLLHRHCHCHNSKCSNDHHSHIPSDAATSLASVLAVDRDRTVDCCLRVVRIETLLVKCRLALERFDGDMATSLALCTGFEVVDS